MCPKGPAWFDFATDIDTAHNLAECSNMGICDTETGQCICRQGFSGRACERINCPMNCNENGECMSMEMYANEKDPGLGTVYAYNTNWDAAMMYGCACDTTNYAVDCSLRYCPVGDDPLTGTTVDPNGQQYNNKQKIICTANGGYFTLSFRKQTTAYIYFSDTLATFTKKLSALTTITSTQSDPGIIVQGNDPVCSFTGATFYVTFTQDFGNLPLLVPNFPKLTHSSPVYLPSVVVSVYVQGTKESVSCSERGTCLDTAGTCTCDTGWDSSDGAGRAGYRGDCGYATQIITYCPGVPPCTANGVCSGPPTYVCTCNTGWTGHDCSLRTCPVSKSWFGYPTANNVAHLDKAECSNIGTCTRSTGTCVCASNFYGSACQYMQCPGKSAVCQGAGQCITIGAAAQLSTINGVIQGYTYGQTPNNPQTWDWDKIYGCYCDREFDTGFTGYDCSLRICPFGDDPLTIHQLNEIQQIACKAGIDSSNSTYGSFTLTFREATTSAIPYFYTAVQLQQILEALPTIQQVNVTSQQPTLSPRNGNYFHIEFLVPTGDVPLLEVTNNGVQTFVTISVQGTKEWAECSNRGICKRSTGECECFEGMGSSDGMGNSGDRGDCGHILAYPEVVTQN